MLEMSKGVKSKHLRTMCECDPLGFQNLKTIIVSLTSIDIVVIRDHPLSTSRGEEGNKTGVTYLLFM